MNTHTDGWRNQYATLKVAQAGLGPLEERTAPAGVTVRILSITTDGQLAYISHGGWLGYTEVSNLTDVRPAR